MLSRLAFYILGKKGGFDMEANKRFVRSFVTWTESQRQQYHQKRLQALIQHAYANVPFYHKQFDQLKLKPEDIQTVQDLEKLPIIRKADVAAHYEEFKAKNMADFQPIAQHTGGTTGIPFQYFNDRKSWAMNWAVKMAPFEQAGYTYGKDRLGVLAGGSMTPNTNMSFKDWLWRYINNYYSMPITHMDDTIMQKYYNELKKQKIQFLRGYPSAVYTFAEYLLENNLILPLKAVFTTAEMLLPHHREMMEKVFNCKIWNTYGCCDGMAAAADCCKHDGMHIYDIVSILQIVGETGKQVGNNEEGEVVLTSLYDYAFPLIRYAPGDRAIASTHKCDCHQTLPMLKKIIGRTSDNFKLSNGRILNALSFPFEDLHTLKRFQIIQEKKDFVRLVYIPKGVVSEEEKLSFKKLIEYHCGEGIKVEVDEVTHIDVPSSGKFRYVISNVK